jgi:hypothetical protein
MANPELKWWHVRWGLWGRRLIKGGQWLAVLMMVSWMLYTAGRFVYGFYAPLQLIQYQSQEPAVWVFPTPLPDRSQAPLVGTRVEAYGYSIQTPWNEQPKSKPHKSITLVTFSQNKAGMMLFDPGEDTSENLPVKMASDPDAKKLFSDRDRGSFYQLTADELAANPNEAKWWTPRKNVQLFMLLSFKELQMINFKSVHKIEAGELRGFQFGDPAKPRSRIMFKLFDSNDRQIRIQVSSDADDASALTQAQLNAMVASIRPAGKK